MKVGLNMVPIVPEQLRDSARCAERLGFESVYYGEHIALPIETKTAHPSGRRSFDPKGQFLGQFAALSHIAAVTEHIRLATGICIVTLRDPLLTAREIMTVDRLSNGRFDFGVGTGTMPEEYEAFGAEWANRGARMDEFLDALDVLWQQSEPSFAGKHYRFPPIGFEPKPVQKPRPPLLIGGLSTAALKRAARRGDGWYGGAGSPDQAAQSIRTLNQMLAQNGRSTEGFEITLIVWTLPDREMIHAYEALGVHRLVVTPFEYPERDSIRKLEDYASRIGLQPRGRS
jgi:probable F420-dependent oxidoreductase